MKEETVRLLPAFGLILASITTTFLATSSIAAVALVIPVTAAFLIIIRLTTKSYDNRKARYSLFSYLNLAYIELKYYGQQLSRVFSHEVVSEEQGLKSDLSKTLNEIGRRISFGEDLPIATIAAARGQSLWIAEKLNRISMLNAAGNDVTYSIKGEANRLEKELAERENRLLGSMQKYLTIGMVISTVLPSFAVFSMVGYSMLYYSIPAVSAFAVLMLAVLPMMLASFRNYLGALYGI